MHDDAKDILWKIGGGPEVQHALRHVNSQVPTSNKYLKIFENVSIHDIRGILKFYENDYKVFGYKIPYIIRRRLKSKIQGTSAV